MVRSGNPGVGLPSTSRLQSPKTDLRVSVDTVPASWSGRGGGLSRLTSGNGVPALDNVDPAPTVVCWPAGGDGVERVA